MPWPCDTVYRANGKRATFDSMSMPEFVHGYLQIIAASLPLSDDTAPAYDHIAYLCHLMADAQHTEWSLVKNSHRQILHMVEQGQITWECAEARNAARAKQLQRAEKAKPKHAQEAREFREWKSQPVLTISARQVPTQFTSPGQWSTVAPHLRHVHKGDRAEESTRRGQLQEESAARRKDGQQSRSVYMKGIHRAGFV